MIDQEKAEEFLKEMHKKDFEKLLLALNLQRKLVEEFGFNVEIHYSPQSSTALINASKLSPRNCEQLLLAVKRAMPTSAEKKYFATRDCKGVRMSFSNDFYIFVKLRREDGKKSQE